jgi:hypothetical protein
MEFGFHAENYTATAPGAFNFLPVVIQKQLYEEGRVSVAKL